MKTSDYNPGEGPIGLSQDSCVLIVSSKWEPGVLLGWLLSGLGVGRRGSGNISEMAQSAGEEPCDRAQGGV